MRQIVKVLPETGIITVDQLRGNSCLGPLIAAYRSHSSNAYCVLTNLSKSGYKAGFIPLNGCNAPRYLADDPYTAIEKASANRKVFLFKSMEEMLKAMVNQDF